MPTINGTNDIDDLDGTSGPDVINGNGGGDLIFGGDGDDLIYGGDEPESPILGDAIDGQGGSDTIYGGIGRDILVGGAGSDFLYGEAGTDILIGGTAVLTGTQSFLFLGGSSSTPVRIYNWSGEADDGVRDYLYGGAGNDQINVFGADEADGGDDTDTLNVRLSNRTAGVNLDLSTDAFGVLAALTGGSYANFELYSVTGTAFADTIVGGATDDGLIGGAGNDVLSGGSGNDALAGDAGDDNLSGGDGNDSLTGGVGSDTLNGGSGNDTVVATTSFSVLVETGFGFVSGASLDDRVVDTIDLGDGDDTAFIGAFDIVSGGLGTDTVHVSLIGLNHGVSLDLRVDAVAAVAAVQGGSMTGIEAIGNSVYLTNYADELWVHRSGNFYGFSGNDKLYGDANVQFFGGNDGDDYIDGAGGNDRIWGGYGADTLLGGDGNDVILADEDNDNNLNVLRFGGNDYVDGGAGNDDIFGGGGDDILMGGDGADRIYGDVLSSTLDDTDVFKGRDNLSGGAGNDFLSGDSGDDVLDGGSGADFLSGGIGFDVASYASSTAGLTVDLLFGSTQNTGDAVGDTFDGIDAISGSGFGDSLRGDNSSNTLRGAGGDDALFGRGGDDRLEGGAGADALYGEAGIDTAIYTSAAAGVTADLQFSNASMGDAGGDVFSSVENLAGSAFSDSLRGDAGANLLFGDAGDDYLFGRDGDDVLDGGAGADQLYGGAGFDTATYSSFLLSFPTGGVIADLQFAYLNAGLAAGDVFYEIEGLSGTQLGDSLRGDAGGNRLEGNAGADTLYGRDGNDTLLGGLDGDTLYGENGDDYLNGGDGNDLVMGGLGADVLDGGAGSDDSSYLYSASGLTVDLQFAGSQNTGEAAGDVFYNIENLVGSGYADSLRGDAGNNVIRGGAGSDFLFGRDGNDVLEGGTGSDTIYGGAGQDVISFATATSGVVVDLMFAASQNTGEAAGDAYFEIEGMIGTAFADSLRGDDGANRIGAGGGSDTVFGRGGDDEILGGNGADLLFGDAGADYLYGGNDNDILFGGTGADVLDGEAGQDRASYLYSSSGLTVDLQFSSSQNTGEAAGDTFYNVEDIAGSGFADSLRGDDGANTLFGNAGDDALYGRDSDDTLSGGAGTDYLTGGEGFDRFLFNAGDGNDVITDFIQGTDRITLSRSAFGFGAIAGIETALTSFNADFITSGTTASSNKATFFWNAGTGALLFDADGTGSGAAVKLATLQVGASLSLSSLYTVGSDGPLASGSEPSSKSESSGASSSEDIQADWSVGGEYQSAIDMEGQNLTTPWASIHHDWM